LIPVESIQFHIRFPNRYPTSSYWQSFPISQLLIHRATQVLRKLVRKPHVHTTVEQASLCIALKNVNPTSHHQLLATSKVNDKNAHANSKAGACEQHTRTRTIVLLHLRAT
jgi:hypothetical protein